MNVCIQVEIPVNTIFLTLETIATGLMADSAVPTSLPGTLPHQEGAHSVPRESQQLFSLLPLDALKQPADQTKTIHELKITSHAHFTPKQLNIVIIND